MKSAIRLRDKSGRRRELTLDAALDEAARILSAGEFQEALLILEKAVRLAPFSARARHLLGESQARAGNLREAAYNLNKAAEADPNNPAYRASLAQALMPADPGAAVPHFLSAILLGSADCNVFGNLAGILLELGRAEDAVKVCDLGLKACPERFALLGYRALILQTLGRPEEALACCREQRDMRPEDTRVWCAMGVALMALGRVAEAEEALRRACLLDPGNAEAHYNLAQALLVSGQYPEGFREYEWRSKTAAFKDRPCAFSQPLWDGGFLDKKRIFLHAEQGAGDTIQFVRYLPLVAKLGGRIVLAVPEFLVRLLRWLPGSFDVMPPGIPAGGFDTHCPLMSLPLLCGTAVESIPPPASFHIPAALRDIWAQRLAGDKPKVALVWAGNPNHMRNRDRSIPLTSFLPLLSFDEANFFSLQLGPPAGELQSAGLGDRICDLSPFLTDYAETAAALSGMDLLISVDTSVAHLAGTLGKPVWVLTPFAPDWRWLLERDDSPWYPTMRLFRQPTQGDWETVIGAVLKALRAWPFVP